eukprot:748838-Hanusia_phi.AAC.4
MGPGNLGTACYHLYPCQKPGRVTLPAGLLAARRNKAAGLTSLTKHGDGPAGRHGAPLSRGLRWLPPNTVCHPAARAGNSGAIGEVLDDSNCLTEQRREKNRKRQRYWQP